MIKEEIDGLNYLVFKSNEFNEKLCSHYIYIMNAVFQCDFSLQKLIIKFQNNLYGESIHVIVYDNENPCAIRSLWRNDLNNKEAYQPCDTAVLEEYRGHHIFGKMTKLALSQINEDSLVYNYPNENSRNLYLKNGWKINACLCIRLFLSNNNFYKKSNEFIDDQYFKWYFESSDDYKIIKVRKSYYLCRRKKFIFYVIIGEISKKIALNSRLEKVRIGIKFYRKNDCKFFKFHPLYIVSKNSSILIPSWKMDAI